MIPESFGLDDGEDSMDATRASILGAYYTLRVEHAAGDIGTKEVARRLKRQWPAREIPSDSVIQRTLVAACLPHRGPGKPSLASRVTPALDQPASGQASPFLPIRREPPRSRGQK